MKLLRRSGIGLALCSRTSAAEQFKPCTSHRIRRSAFHAPSVAQPAHTSMSGLMDKVKAKVSGFKDGETGKTGAGGVMAEGKERYADYNADKADGKVNWGQQAKDAAKDWKPNSGGAAGAGGAAPQAPPQ